MTDILLESDHAKLDAIFASASHALDSADRPRAFEQLDRAWAFLAIHIRAEHLHLFPTLLRHAAMPDIQKARIDREVLEQTIAELRRDHDFFIRRLGDEVNKLRFPPSMALDLEFRSVKASILIVQKRLDRHNRIEEDDIYPLAGAMLSKQELTELKARIGRELAKVPPRFMPSAPHNVRDQI